MTDNNKRVQNVREVLAKLTLISENSAKKEIGTEYVIDLLSTALADPIPVKEIWMRREEGATRNPMHTVHSWEEASRVLRDWSNTAPADFGYDKCSFIVKFNDDTAYQGRYDLKHFTIEQPSLSAHVYNALAFRARRRCPAGKREEEYAKILKVLEQRNPGQEKSAAHMLDTYDIPSY